MRNILMSNLDPEITIIKNDKKEGSPWEPREREMILLLLQVLVHIMSQVKI